MGKPLHLLVIGVANPMETFLDRLLRGLADRGIQITIASDRKPDNAWLESTRARWLRAPMWQGTKPMTLWHLSSNTIRSLLAAHSDAQTIWRLIKPDQSRSTRLKSWYMLTPFAGQRWNVIYFPWNSHAIAYLPIFSLGMPVVLSCRGSQVNVAPHNPRRSDLRAGLRLSFEQAARVHCVSRDILNEAQVWGLESERARIIYPAVDPDFFVPLLQRPHRGDGIFRILTTGSLIWRKGLEYALLAVRALKDAGIPVSFEIIGDGPERDRVLFTIHDLELQENVLLRGRLSPDNVLAGLQNADVFLLASLSEGISNAVLEAMACGLPIVTSDCGGMREAVTDGVEGFVIPLRDAKAMAQALKRLWEAPELRMRMGEAGRMRILHQFSLADQVNAFTQMFNEVCAR